MWIQQKIRKSSQNTWLQGKPCGGPRNPWREIYVAVELWTYALDSGTQFSTYVGDGDSTTIADILNKVPYKIKKWSDTIHTKRSLTTRLYNLKDRFKNPNSSTLSYKVISYNAKCFSYAVTQNAGNPEFWKSSINSIVPHWKCLMKIYIPRVTL